MIKIHKVMQLCSYAVMQLRNIFGVRYSIFLVRHFKRKITPNIEHLTLNSEDANCKTA
jgi:hypothetical protein